jgi:hypothetical protein
VAQWLTARTAGATHRAANSLRKIRVIAPEIYITAEKLLFAYVRLRSELTYLLVSCRAGREEARSPPVPRHHHYLRG